MAWTVEISDVAEKQLHRLDARFKNAFSTGSTTASKGARILAISGRRYVAIYPGCGASGSVIIALSARFTMTGWLSWPWRSVVDGKSINP